MMHKLPHDIESERALLGSLILDNQNIPLVLSEIAPSDFYVSQNRLLFQGILEFYEAGSPADIVALNSYMLEKQPGFAGIAEITKLAELATPSLVDNYAKIVKSKSARRRQYKACFEGAQIALNESEYSVAEAFLEIDKKLKEAANVLPHVEVHEISNLAKQRYNDYYENKKTNGIKTGFIDIDKIINFMADGQLIIIAGRPGMGKTQLACDIALNVSKDVNTLYFTMEMTKERITDRLICSISEINGNHYKARTLTEEEQIKAISGIGELTKRRIRVVDKSVTTKDIRSRCYREKYDNGLGLVIIDYLGKIADKRQKGMTGDEHLGSIVNSLQVMGKELNVPVVLLCQLNRQVEYRKPPMPLMADLRGSGNIEQDADVIMFIYRDEYYTSKRPGEADVIIEKNRDGSPGRCVLTFSSSEPKFKNMSKFKYQ
ncbi:MAG: AAA family ATPase [Dethiobacter sp.]|jgi:replicative DNA helicase|nr:AAA family ATPase [Dethiobacter sp.]